MSGSSPSRERKRKFYRKQHFNNGEGSQKFRRFGRRRGIEPGDQGFLVTCQNGQQSRAENEVLDLLYDYLDLDEKFVETGASGEKSSPTATVKENPDPVDDDLEKALQHECDGLKTSNNGQNRPNGAHALQPVDSGVKNNCFIRLTSPDSCETPSFIVHKIFRDLHAKGLQRGRYGHRLIPVDVTFKPYDKDFFEACKNCVEKYFTRGSQNDTANSPETYAVHFKHKNNSGSNLTKELVCDYVAECLVQFKLDFKIDLDRPDVTILVEVLGKIGFISIAKDYYALGKYNLQKTVDEIQNLHTKGDDASEN